MLKKNLGLFLFSTIIFTGCIPYDYDRVEAKKTSVSFLCRNYSKRTHIYDLESPNITNELTNRNIFTNKEWSFIKKGTIFQGMSYSAVLCSMGTYFYEWKNTIKWEKKSYYAIEYMLDAETIPKIKTETSILLITAKKYKENSLFVYFDRKTDKVIKWEIRRKTMPDFSLMKDIIEKNRKK